MAHAALSIGLWNNMMQREGDKDTTLDPATVRIVCPAGDARVRLRALLPSRAADARACSRSLLCSRSIHQLSAAVCQCHQSTVQPHLLQIFSAP